MAEYRFIQASGDRELTRKVNEAAAEGFTLLSTKIAAACISKREFEGACALVLLATMGRDGPAPAPKPRKAPARKR